MKSIPRFLPLALAGLLGFQVMVTGARASTYYVDYSGLDSDDSRNGTSPSTSWKHCPGDTQVTSTNALFNKTFAAGDTVIFKGGVEYKARPLKLISSGTDAAPIVLDGNTAGTYGSGAAVFTGADRPTGWRVCTSSADAFGAADWANCYRLDSPTLGDPDPITAALTKDIFSSNLFYDANVRGVPARSPEAADPFAWDAISGLKPLTASQITQMISRVVGLTTYYTTVITIPSNFVPAPVSGNDWTGAYVAFRNSANRLTIQPVIASDGLTLTLDETTSQPIADPNKAFYLFNHTRLLTQRGEYVLTNSNQTIIFYAGAGGAAPANTQVTRYFSTPRPTGGVPIEVYGINLNQKSYWTIQGFVFQNYAGYDGDGRGGAGILHFNPGTSTHASNITIQNCMFQNNASITNKVAAVQIDLADNVTMDSCNVHDNQGSRGISMFGDLSKVTNNSVIHNGNTAVFTSGGNTQTISGNYVLNNNGLHGNGISVYGPTDGATVERNRVVNSNIGMTFQGCKNVSISYNVIRTAGTITPALAIYGPRTTDYDAANIILKNNTLIADDYPALRVDDQVRSSNDSNDGDTIVGLAVENNIIGGYTYQAAQPTAYNKNYFLLPGGGYSGSPLPPGVPTNFLPDGKDPFVSRSTNDLHLVSSATAVNTGLTWTFPGGDIEGNSIVGQRDIGAYEYGSSTQPQIVVQDNGTTPATALTDGVGSVPFGTVPAGQTANRNFTISNQGVQNLTGLAVTVTGSNAADFVITQPAVTTLTTGTSTTFVVGFSPTATGSKAAILHIASNDPNHLSFAVSVTGNSPSPTPQISVQDNGTTPATTLTDGVGTVLFGTVATGQMVSRIFTISNLGIQNLTGLAVTVTGSNAADFTITQPAVTTLTTGTSTTFQVRFNPTVTGSKAAVLRIASNDPNHSSFSVSMTGAASSPAATTIESWRQIYFGTTANTGDAADSADPDRDGLSNYQEYGFGLNPTQSQPDGIVISGAGSGSSLVRRGTPTTLVPGTGPGTFRYALFGRRKNYLAAGLTYTVQFSADLVVWVDSRIAPTVVAVDSEIQAVTIPYPTTTTYTNKCFFRVKIIPSAALGF